MGLLDDAIREHLDLKRRRGADPAEVARLEQEALGPVRREPAPEPEAAPARDEREPPAEVAPAHEENHDDHDDGPDPHAAEASHAHALAPEERHDPPHGDPLNQPTTEYRVEDDHDDEPEHASSHEADEPEHAEPEPGGSREDVLEETPDFLQETPEHDRLWFEQRPPRDFDFDG